MSIVTGLKCLLKDTYQYFAMSSSHVEVRESVDSASNNLPFAITACESNGVDIQADGEPPRDHTYNKDPDVISECEVVDSIKKEEPPAADITKGRTKQQKDKKLRNTNSKFTKPLIKKESSKKSLRKVQEVSETPDSTTTDQENATAAPSVEEGESISLKSGLQKNSRKRKNLNSGNEAVEAKQVKSLDSDFKADSTKNDKDLTDDDDDKEKNKIKVAKKQKATLAKNMKTKKPSKVKKVLEKGSLTAPITPKASKKSKDVGNADANLPPGWTKKIVVRKSGKTAGAFDIYIYSPEGMKFRSKPDIAAYLTRTKSPLKLEDFDFTKRQVDAGNKSAPENKASQNKGATRKKKSGAKKSGKIVVKLSTPRKNVLSDKENEAGKKGKKSKESANVSSKRVARKK